MSAYQVKNPRRGSWLEFLSQFEVGERHYQESSLEQFKSDEAKIQAYLARRPEKMLDWKFSASLLTAVGSSKAGDIRYLICIERTK